jgi:hypothetical protein
MNLTYFFKYFFYSIKLSSVHFLSLKFFVIWLIHTLSFEGVDPLDCEKLLRLVNLDWYIAFSYIASKRFCIFVSVAINGNHIVEDQHAYISRKTRRIHFDLRLYGSHLWLPKTL